MVIFKNKNLLASYITSSALIALVLLLAGNVGFWLYNPSRFDSVLSYCTLNIIRGSADVQTPDTIAWEEATDGMKLETGSRVKTGEDSHVLLTFSEGSTTKVGPRSELVVAKLEGNRENYPDVILLKQQSGSTWNQVAKLSNANHRFEVATPSANVMARGTLFLVDVDDSGKTVTQTTQGQVDVSAQSSLVHVFAGQQTEAAPGAPPSVPKPMPPPSNQLVVNVSSPGVGMVIDPHGALSGYLPDGSALNQIAGSSSSAHEATHPVIVIPKLSSGEYTVVLRGVADGKADYNIEALSDGKSTFQNTGSFEATTGNEWQLRLRVDTTGKALRVSVVDPNLAEAGSEHTAAVARATETKPDQPDNNWLWTLKKEQSLGYWIAGGILLMSLAILSVRLYR